MQPARLQTGIDFIHRRTGEADIYFVRNGSSASTEGDVLEAPLLIEQKARDMLRHYASVVLPEGFKAQVVATSRQAAVTLSAEAGTGSGRTRG